MENWVEAYTSSLEGFRNRHDTATLTLEADKHDVNRDSRSISKDEGRQEPNEAFKSLNWDKFELFYTHFWDMKYSSM